MLSRHVAIVAHSNEVPLTELMSVTSAIQIQITRDFAPLWNINASVSAFQHLSDVPVGHWPIIIKKNIHDKGDLGYHTDKRHQPYALVQYDDGWPATVSHEALEMLVDPFGSRLVAGPAIPEFSDTARVLYLLELCDPCEDSAFGYTINGVLVSDFILPAYHEPVETKGARYSFSGAIERPRQILKNGYLSFEDPKSGKWYQASASAHAKITVKENKNAASAKSLREGVHAAAQAEGLPHAEVGSGYHKDDASVKFAEGLREGARLASEALSERLTKEFSPA